MYTRKPKNITKFLVGISAADALHTWEYADKAKRSRIGSTASISLQERKRREANRKTIGSYRNSNIATMAARSREDVVKFTKIERQKLEHKHKNKSE